MGGWIKVYSGPMFSRKTEELLIELKRYNFANKKVALFKHSIDTRLKDMVKSHDGRYMPAIAVNGSGEIAPQSGGYEVIGIDEAQFFDEGIIEVVSDLADDGRRVIIAGLDKDYLGKPFGPMPGLLAIADEVIKLTAVCMICGEPATFSARKVSSDQSILIGGEDVYEPRCRTHFRA